MKNILLIAVLAAASEVFAQERIHLHQPQIWGGYITSIRIQSRLSLWNDAHFVPGSFMIGRHGLTVHTHEQVSITGGYAWLLLSTPGNATLRRFEHRPWSQIVFNFPVGTKYQFHQRVRYDMRFRQQLAEEVLLSEFGLTHRLRFMFSVRRPLIGRVLGKEIPFIVLANETLLNLGKNVRGNNLDQNRTWMMLGYEMDQVTLQFGYMYRFVPSALQPEYRHFHTATIWVSQVFTTKKKRRKYLEEMLHREP